MYVVRVFPGETLIAHIGDDSGVSDEGIEYLKRMRRNLYLRREGEACLGIIVNSYELAKGILVADVVPNSPASEAGIKRGDLVVLFGDRRIRYLEELRQLSSQYRPGDRVEIQLVRDSHRIRMKMFLGTDFGSQDCRCLEPDCEESVADAVVAKPSNATTHTIP